MKIAVFNSTKFIEKEFSQNFNKNQIEFYPESIDNYLDIDFSDVDIISVFGVIPIKGITLSHFPNLKFISTRSTGIEHIDFEYCNKHKILVSNVPSYGETSIAEHTIALILALSHNIVALNLRAVKGDFHTDDLIGFELKEKTIGIIGTGRIGVEVAKLAKGLGMNVLCYSNNISNELIKSIGAKYVNKLSDLLKSSDVVSLHIPLSKENNHFIDEKELSVMKHSAIIINTARGGLINTQALYKALKNKSIAGAGLDVIEGEEYIFEDMMLLENHSNKKIIKEIYRDEKLFRMENVIFTQHNAFRTQEAISRLIKVSQENIVSFLRNDPKNIVN